MPLNLETFQAEIKQENQELHQDTTDLAQVNHDDAILLALRAVHERLGDMMMLLARNY